MSKHGRGSDEGLQTLPGQVKRVAQDTGVLICPLFCVVSYLFLIVFFCSCKILVSSVQAALKKVEVSQIRCQPLRSRPVHRFVRGQSTVKQNARASLEDHLRYKKPIVPVLGSSGSSPRRNLKKVNAKIVTSHTPRSGKNILSARQIDIDVHDDQDPANLNKQQLYYFLRSKRSLMLRIKNDFD